MIKRIELVIQSQNLTPSQFADRIGIQRSGLSHILSGRNNPSLDFVQKVLAAFPELNPAWFLQGKGRMYVNLTDTESLPFRQEFTPVPAEESFENSWEKENPEAVFPPRMEAGIPSETASPETAPEKPETLIQPEIEAEIARNKETKPKLRRILLFYEDGTFEEYAKR